MKKLIFEGLVHYDKYDGYWVKGMGVNGQHYSAVFFDDDFFYDAKARERIKVTVEKVGIDDGVLLFDATEGEKEQEVKEG